MNGQLTEMLYVLQRILVEGIEGEKCFVQTVGAFFVANI